jgi:hypothetical protein
MKKALLFLTLAVFCLHFGFSQTNQANQPQLNLNNFQFKKSDQKAKLRSSLQELEAEYLDALKQGASSSTFKSSHAIIMITDGLVRIEAVAKRDAGILINELERLGAQQIDSYKRIVNAWYPISNISQLALIEELQFVKPVYHESPDIGAATSEGELALQALAARDTYCVDGSGIRVGVISDSYTSAFPGGAAAGVASGDIPGAGNPNGFTTPVTVVNEGPPGIDEGRAMIEIVHDLAPGAQIFFNTSSGGQATYATAINNLASVSNCDIIVDDVRYFEEPFYMDGLIAQACDNVFANGVPYFASAGNYAQSSYESVYRDSNGSFNAHDFDPTASRDTLQSITVNGGSRINLTLQWDDPWGSITPNSANTDLDVWLFNAGGALVASSTDFNIGGDPTEFFSYTAPAGGAQTFRILITRSAGPDPSVLKWVIRNANGLVINEYPPTTINAQSTGYGHSNAAGANAVGAAFWGNTPAYGVNPPLPEGFTSSGGVQIRYNTNGVAITPITRNKPNFTAVDGTSNTFFGNGNNFFGTSAAAPHAAAVAALMLEANNSLTPTQVRNLLVNSSIDMLTPGFDFITGSGLIQADIVLQNIFGALCNISNISVQSGPTCVEGGTYSVTVRVSYTDHPDCNDELWVNGQVFPATGANFQDVTLTGLIPDGNPESVTAYFVSAPGCNLTVSNLYTAPAAPVAQNSIVDISCSGDPFNISLQNNITNGVLSDFDWIVNYNGLQNGNGGGSGDVINESLNNLTGALASAVYTVYPTGELQGCEGNSFTVTVNVPPLLTSEAVAISDYNGFNISCYGGSDGEAEAMPTGGTEPYDYLWSNGADTKIASDLSAGSYSVTITDANGCSSLANVTLTEPTPLTIDAGENQTVYYGYPPAECATISWSGEGGGVPPYIISWDDGGAQSHEVCPGEFTTIYTVTIEDANGCIETDEVKICVIDVRCGKKLDKVELCHIPPGNPNKAHTICVSVNAVATHLEHGDVLGACGIDHSCDDDAKSVPDLPISSFEAETTLNAYPNPFNTTTTIEFSSSVEGRITLELFDYTGKLIKVLYNSEAEAGIPYEVKVDASGLQQGLMFCILKHSDGTVKIQKLVLNN